MEFIGNIVDIKNREIYKGKVITNNNIITDVIRENNNCENYILPGLVNSHVHIESSMVSPLEFSKEAIKWGTVGVVSDPHEIANVLGIEGINYMVENSKLTPLKIFFGVPSCVPATNFETSGATINSEITKTLIKKNEFKFLSEMMNFPGVIYDDIEVHKKLQSAIKYNKKIDGHAPGLTGKHLAKYIKSGITTDHECSTLNEAIEKINLGMHIQIREGSAAKNFDNLYQLIDSHTNNTMICTDDTHPDDLINGHINEIVKKAISKNLDIFNILQVACINPVNHYNLEIGLLKKGDLADFIIVDNLKDFNVLKTIINGNIEFENNKISFTNNSFNEINNFNTTTILEQDLALNLEKNTVNVINCFNRDLFTKLTIENINSSDILKIVVYNRYKKTKPSVAYIKNFGLNKGSIAQSIAHDSHNIIAVGTSDKNISIAINKIIENKGGICVYDESQIYDIKLEIAGLMTNLPVIEIAEKYKLLTKKAIEIGSKLNSPFMTLSFMALLVIPELKISDKGLFDGNKFEFIDL